MSANEKVQPYSELETSALATCSRCKQLAYKESIVETLNTETGKVSMKRVCVGSFYQALGEDGFPLGPIIPFCNCGEK